MIRRNAKQQPKMPQTGFLSWPLLHENMESPLLQDSKVKIWCELFLSSGTKTGIPGNLTSALAPELSRLVHRLLNLLGFVALKMGRRQGARRAHPAPFL